MAPKCRIPLFHGPLLGGSIWLRYLDFVYFVSLDVMHEAHHQPKMQVQSGSRVAMLQKLERTREDCDYPLQLSLVTLLHFLLAFSSPPHLLTDTHTHSLCDQLRLKEDAPPDCLVLCAHSLLIFQGCKRTID